MVVTAADIERRLDDIEEQLPPVPAAWFRFQRGIAKRMVWMVDGLVSTWKRSLDVAADATDTSLKTVAGTARSAGRDTVETATTATKRVVGQAEAEARQAASTAREQTARAVDATAATVEQLQEDASDAISAAAVAADPERSLAVEAYDEMTRDELYRRATELDITGRSRMTKQELIEAIRAAD